VKFYMWYNVNSEERLNRFRSPFWSEEKKWYFAITRSFLFSLSCYDGQMLLSNLRVPDHTAPDNDWFYSYPIIYFDSSQLTQTLTFVNQWHDPEHLFNGQELQLTGNFDQSYASSLIQFIEKRVDLSCIKKLLYTDPLLMSIFLLTFKTQMSSLSELNISLAIDAKDLQRFPPFERIQRIECSSELSTALTKDFIRVFFNVEHLVIKIQSRHQIFCLINGLIHLQSVQFYCDSKFKSITRDELIKRTRLRYHSFTIKFFSYGQHQRLNLWINQSPSSQLIKQSSTNHNNRMSFFSCCL
jgi:hypothetical protein